jgi:hypothetical protein
VIRRSLTRRLEELEAHLIPIEPIAIQIVYVDGDGNEEPDGEPIVISRAVPAPYWLRKQG